MFRNVFSFGIFVLSVLAIVTIVKPRFDAAQVLKIQQADLEEALENSRRLEATWNDLVARYGEFSDQDLEKISKFLPANIDNVKLIIELDDLARSLGLELIKADASEAEGQQIDQVADYGTVSMNIQVRGEYEAFVAFMSKLERSLRLIDIRQVDFSATDVSDIDPLLLEDPVPLIYDYTLSFDTYWLQ